MPRISSAGTGGGGGTSSGGTRVVGGTAVTGLNDLLNKRRAGRDCSRPALRQCLFGVALLSGAAGLRAGRDRPVCHSRCRGVKQSLNVRRDQGLGVVLRRYADATVARVEVERAERIKTEVIAEVDLLNRVGDRSRQVLL